MTEGVLIFGAGGFGREVAWLARDIAATSPSAMPLAFIDDAAHLRNTLVAGLPVLSLETAAQQYGRAALIVAVGRPQTREAIVAQTADLGFWFPVVIHPSVAQSEYVSIGQGSVICARNTLTTDIEVGDHTHVNLSCTIGHDVRVGRFCTISPGVHISGWVHIGNRVFIGTGAVFVNGTQDNPLTVGDDAIIGAGACVTRSVPPGVTVVGIPAKSIDKKG